MNNKRKMKKKKKKKTCALEHETLACQCHQGNILEGVLKGETYRKELSRQGLICKGTYAGS
jgi:hypothetical protein